MLRGLVLLQLPVLLRLPVDGVDGLSFVFLLMTMEGGVLFNGAPSGQVEGHFPARRAVGIPFCAGKDTFFCSEPPLSTFRAGLGAFSCPGGGGYLEGMEFFVKFAR